MLAVSSTFCTRLMARVRSWTKLLRERSRSRRSRMGLGGIKLALSKPWHSNCAIHALSLAPSLPMRAIHGCEPRMSSSSGATPKSSVSLPSEATTVLAALMVPFSTKYSVGFELSM